ncbi:PREDICTED: probable NADH dehydrogenase [ubiquinone] 1 alpha subcomplex subunit 12 [Dufourea novaeangliae]|uniref:NADH dehydrogenase [ubiquinone] 1 alpha subcomplex subunit 12 n=1 Tax=Dufourea novaeangliae TaxID=178035 RepID=A0A154NX39_DUFNO|nr:PREDICTED: probable NADH dehydrogenase [ubiquinone] 1 alpha subcomplex subunit 12 [Dufourea novaeangliae]KZC04229.1 putative NADH dehydrogenase [ubiquinone] 1 alpha subcomplex subunit 12 [Dufourea novaeangliae]
MAKLLGLDKVVKFVRIIRENGGIFKSLRTAYRMDTLKSGTCVGEDEFGNRYFENNEYFYGTNRWVVYSDRYGMDYDGSQVTPEWFGWLHYKTDLLPHKDPSRPKHKWMTEHKPNLSGTNEAYMPYSTVPPKIQPWKPQQ